MEEDNSAPLPDPREFLVRRPKKSILKTTSSFDRERKEASPTREAHFDEMNILQTYHPLDKDYGHIKIDEPKTPYNNYSDSENEECTSEGVRRVSISEPVCIDFEPGELDDIVAKKRSEKPMVMSSDVDTDDEELSEEQKERKRQFELKRKKHYNEFQAVKLAKQLLAQQDETVDDDDAAAGAGGDDAECSSSSSSMPCCSHIVVTSEDDSTQTTTIADGDHRDHSSSLPQLSATTATAGVASRPSTQTPMDFSSSGGDDPIRKSPT